MIREGMKVQVYDGDLIGWTNGRLVKHLGEDRWTILTAQGYEIDRHIKEDYSEILSDGCGYAIKTLYEFLEQLYESYEKKYEIDFDTFIEGFLEETISTHALHEAFSLGDFLGLYGMSYEIDHEERKIELSFKKEQ